MFLVDGSGSVPPATFQEFKQFMVRLVKKFDIGPNTTHVGLLQYSSKPQTGLEFHFREHQTELAVVNAINEVEYHYGAYTFGGYAMDLAQQVPKVQIETNFIAPCEKTCKSTGVYSALLMRYFSLTFLCNLIIHHSLYNESS